jgi:ABC-2 type transport system ATP-binding protein
VVLDEPVNGLDPEGILWVRNLLKGLAAEGRTVLVSSHLMSEMAMTADHLIVIGRGRLIADMSVEEFTRSASSEVVWVRTPHQDRLAGLLTDPGLVVDRSVADGLQITGMSSDAIGELAAANGIALHELTPVRASLEEAFMELTQDSVEYHGGSVAS